MSPDGTTGFRAGELVCSCLNGVESVASATVLWQADREPQSIALAINTEQLFLAALVGQLP